MEIKDGNIDTPSSMKKQGDIDLGIKSSTTDYYRYSKHVYEGVNRRKE